jgi:glutathione-regulated potassium-efflux system ancillary protein KefC
METLPGWLSYSLIYLGAAVLAVPLFRALGLGAVIGYLVAGIAIGPWGLALVSEVDDILNFAQFGVVLMLFLVGLELDPRRLWSLRRPIFGWGTAQMVLCTALLHAIGLALGLGWQVSLVAAMGLSLSSTAVALQVMGERNLLGTHSGRSCIAVSLFQDVASLPMLALLPLLALAPAAAADAPHGSAWVEAAKIVGVIVAIIGGGRLLLRPLLRWIARRGTPEIFTATALLLVVGTSALMHLAGLSMALGAFLAGVLLADSEYRRALETDIEPFKGLLLGLFFMAVGMSMDLGVLAGRPALMAALVLGFVGVKALAVAMLARWMDIPLAERPVFVLMLAQGSEFAFVIFQAAAGVGVLPGETASVLTGAVALSMALTPLLVVLVEKTLLPRFAAAGGRRLDEISEPQDAPVIIAGFGRYGQIIGRLLNAQGIRATVLDHDADMVEAARSFGYQVFYGDATRLDLLRTAGAAAARVLVVAVDDPEQSLKVVELAREHFPHLELVARARDVTHWNALRDRGVQRVEREVFESSLRSGRTVLEVLGLPAHEARRQALRFRRHNLALFEQMYPHHQDRAKLIAVVKQGRRQLEEQMAHERAERQARRERGQARPPGWDDA